MPLHGEHGQLAEVDRLGARGEGAAAEAREVEQVADEALEAACLALDHQTGGVGLEHAVLEGFRVPPDRGQRRLQLVADREEEGALGVLGLLELGREVVERRRERRDLPRPVHGQRLGVLACRERAARLGDARDGPGDGAREGEGDEPGERRSHEAGETEPERERRPVRRLARRGAEQHDRLVPFDRRAA